MRQTRISLMLALVVTSGSLAGARAPGTSASTAMTGQGSPVSDPWTPWLGCWTPDARTITGAQAQLCVVPAPDGRGVRRLTFADNREILAETMVADGSRQPVSETGCSGSRTSHWAMTGPRLFSSSTLNCTGEPELRIAGISALVASDRWVEVHVSDTGGREQVRTRRYWRSSGAPPAPIADVVRGLTTARVPRSSLSADDVIEASREVAAIGVEAWLVESGVRVPIGRRTLVRLSDAKVGNNVIDLLVALAFPRKFEVRRTGIGSGGSNLFSGSWLDGYGPAEWGDLADIYGFGFGSFGVPYYLGYNGYYQPGSYHDVAGSGGGGGASDNATHGQVVNGQGYTRVQPREPYRGTAAAQGGGSSTASSAGADSGGGGSGSGGGASSGGASPSGYSGGGGTSTGLTAVPR